MNSRVLRGELEKLLIWQKFIKNKGISEDWRKDQFGEFAAKEKQTAFWELKFPEGRGDALCPLTVSMLNYLPLCS